MAEFVVPTEDLEELVRVMDEGKVEDLRDHYPEPRRTKQPLTRYTSRIWLFPFGIHPSHHEPLQVWRNGMSQWIEVEVKLFRVGKLKPITVLVFEQPTHETDRVQASYTAVPIKGTHAS